MNEEILNSFWKVRVAKTLRSTCEALSIALAVSRRRLAAFSLTQRPKKHKTLSKSD
jgi:hypothetical protein